MNRGFAAVLAVPILIGVAVVASGAIENVPATIEDDGPGLSEPGRDPGLPDEPAPALRSTATAIAAQGDPAVAILVVDKATGRPVADTELFVADPDFAWQKLPPQKRAEIEALPQIDYEWLLSRYGLRARTDARGVARIRPDSRPRVVVCRRDGLYGEIRVDGTAEANRWRLELEPDQRLRVLVVDAQGQPVPGTRLSCIVRSTKQNKTETKKWKLGSTNADGHLERRHLQLDTRRWIDPDLTLEPVHIVAEVPGTDAKTRSFDLRAPPSGILRLELPSLGAVAIAITDAGGRSVGPGKRIEMRLAEKKSGRALWRGTTDDHGRMRIAAIPVGLRLHVRGWVQREIVSKEFTGPTVAGQVVPVPLSLPAGMATLQGRLLNSDGGVEAKRRVLLVLRHRLTLRRSGETIVREHRAEAVTDGGGRFFFALNSYLVGKPLAHAAIVPRQTKSSRLIARFASPAMLVAGHNDAGDVTLTPAPVVVSGQVVDRDGPVTKGVEAFIERAFVWTRNGEQREFWRRTSLTVEVSMGGFRAYGYPIADKLRLRVRASGFQPVEPIGFTPGQNVTVRVQRAATLEAVVLANPKLPAERLRLTLGNGSHTFTGKLVSSENGRLRYRWDQLSPGSYVATARAWSFSRPLVTIAGIRVEIGRQNHDPRLDGIDLRQLRVIELRVLDASGKPIQRAAVFHVQPDRSRRKEAFGVADGRLQFVADRPLDLEIVAPRHRHERLSQVFADTEVRLTGADPCQLIVKPAQPLPSLPADTKVMVYLRAISGAPAERYAFNGSRRALPIRRFLRQRNPFETLASAGTTTISGLEPGSYEIRVYVRVGRNYRPVQGVTPGRVEIANGQRTAVVELTIPAANVASAHAAAQR